MTTIEERTEYLNNPFFTKHIYGDYTPFYVTIAVCTVVITFLFVLNLICGCCSQYKYYWQDKHTGNRWLVSLWTVSPHQQPPLDLTELKDGSHFDSGRHFDVERPVEYTAHRPQQLQHHQRGVYQQEYIELHKKESDI
jgi:hypothetical protein